MKKYYVNDVFEPNLVDKIAEEVIRAAVGFKPLRIEEQLPRSLREIVSQVVSDVARDLVGHRNGLLFCGICGRGPFTPIGLYLHLKRTHIDRIARIVREELEDRILHFAGYGESNG